MKKLLLLTLSLIALNSYGQVAKSELPKPGIVKGKVVDKTTNEALPYVNIAVKDFDNKKIAGTILGLSGICCLISPILFQFENKYLFLFFLLIWGIVVIGDSPLFSSLVAKNAETQIKGTALTIVNCIGFAITIISIQLLNIAKESLTPKYLFLLLVFGTVLGLLALFHTKKKSA